MRVSFVNVPWTRIVLVGLAYHLAACFGIELTREAGNVTALWLPNAIVLGFLLRQRGEQWIALLAVAGLGNIAANIAYGDTMPAALGLAAINLLEIGVAYGLIRQFDPLPFRLDSLRSLMLFASCCVVIAPSVAAVLGVLLVSTSSDLPFWIVWDVRFFADAMGVLLVTPIIVNWSWPSFSRFLSEFALLEVLISIAAVFMVLTVTLAADQSAYLFMIAPILLWHPLRFGSLPTSVMAFLLGSTMITATIFGYGPIALLPEYSVVQKIQLAQLFVCFAAVPSLIVALSMAQLRENRQRLDLAINGADAAVFDWHIPSGAVSLNSRSRTMLGDDATQSTSHIDEFYARLHPADRPPTEAALQEHFAGATEFYDMEHRQRRADGSWLWVNSLGKVVEWDAQDRPVRMSGIRIDISKRKEAELALQHIATHDALTGLPNRRAFSDKLAQELDRIRADGGALALLMLDLDDFKQVNDAHGHEAGDQVLNEVAARLSGSLRQDSLLARLGGDEFALLVTDPALLRQLPALATRLIKTLEQPIAIGDSGTVHVGICIGISQAPDDGELERELMHQADRALYRAKTAGRNQYCLVDATYRANGVAEKIPHRLVETGEAVSGSAAS